MKKRQIITCIIILLIVIGIPYFININNIGIGPKGMFYQTISDYPNTEWVCKEPKAKITVTLEHPEERIGKAIMVVKINGEDTKFRIYTMANKIELCRLDENENEIDNATYEGNENVILTKAVYKKNIWGVVTSFQINMFYEEQSIAGYKTLKFNKVN